MSKAATTPPPDALSFYNLPFEIMQEDWSRYELDDGNGLRVRVFLVQLRGQNVPPQKGDKMAFEFSQTIKIDAPPNRRGKSGHPATPEELAKPKDHGGEEVRIRNSSEPWNEYHVSNTNVRIRVKAIVNRVLCLKERFDRNGDPVYVINVATLPVVEP